jgi:murein DD-endopeptidase MepM/ murein hydrolase activator NlpD
LICPLPVFCYTGVAFIPCSIEKMLNNLKSTILAQNAGRLMPRLRLRLLAVLILPLFGMAAFGIAPQTDVGKIPQQTVIEELRLPELRQDTAQTEPYWREEQIQRGDTVASLLARLNVDQRETLQLLRHPKALLPFKQLKPGKTVQAQVDDEGGLLLLRYVNANGSVFVARKAGDDFTFDEKPLLPERRLLIKSGEISSSLFAATDAVDLPDNIATQTADIFSSDIDFHRDLRKADRFSVVYEMFYDHGTPMGSGRVLAAEFVNQGRAYQAFYFNDGQGHGGYYTADGKNVRKAFLRSPLEFSRVTSGFSISRFHPLLKEWRAHKGIDYAAPIGTKVKATANGTVVFAGSQGGYGNMVVLRHQGVYSTVYGHLSAFAQGLHHGQKVSQGDVIGYVGMTGLATGPHVHYEFRVNGAQRNPQRIAVPDGPPIITQLKPAFNATAAPLQSELNMARRANFAKLD